MTTPLIIYHGKCQDGQAAAWAAWLLYGPAGTYVPAFYGEPPPSMLCPETQEPRDVLVVDFSYPRTVLEEMHRRARTLRVLDHHKTAREYLEGLPYCTFDMERSGAGLSWDTLHPGKPRPWIIDYVEDRDLWRHRLPSTHEINAWLHENVSTWESYDRALALPLEEVVLAGSRILAERRVYIEETKSRARYGTLAGHRVPVVACGRHCASEIVGELSEGHPFAVSWEIREGSVHYQLRSRRGGLDVSRVAQQFGGGGHPGAAGFQTSSPVHTEESE